jgi:outer membrane autotransporter protein
MNSFTEDGPTALSYQDQSDDSLRSQLGFELRYATHIGDVGLVPHLSAAWQHEYLANDRGITSSFPGNGGGTFSVQTQRADQDSAFIDVGIDANLDRNWTLFLDYQTEAGGDDFYAQSFSGGARYGF